MSIQIDPRKTELIDWVKKSIKPEAGESQIVEFIHQDSFEKKPFFRLIDDLHDKRIPGVFLPGNSAYQIKKQYESLFSAAHPKVEANVEPKERLINWIQESKKAYPKSYPGEVGAKIIEFINQNSFEKEVFFSFY